ncbi:MAG: DnaD domain protein [Erysipelotrichaceae bacterium]|nr:DnaD domain protein [Erysipelotrichaceae bacterium]
MIGQDLYRIDCNFEMDREMAKSLVLFYKPLITDKGFFLYHLLSNLPNNPNFLLLNDLLVKTNMSISEFEDGLSYLNQYNLVRTFKHQKEEKYILLIKKPLDRLSFMNDSLLSRELILKIGGPSYQSLAADVVVMENDLSKYNDVSIIRDSSALSSWKSNDEAYHKAASTAKSHSFFDTGKFLADISVLLFPMKFRTQENLNEIALLADLYSISYDQMRKFITNRKVCTYDSETMDLGYLSYLCQKASLSYQDTGSHYDSPCTLFLANLQDGKEATPYDKKVIFKLAHDYVLPPAVINVLLEHSLSACGGRLIEKYVYGVASDLHRMNINSYEEALAMLKGQSKKRNEDKLPEYDNSTNPDIDINRLDDILKQRGE